MTTPTQPEATQDAGVEPSGGAASGQQPPASAPSPHDPTENKALAAMRRQLAAKDKELEALRQSAMTEQEKAIAQAKTEGAGEFRAKWLQAVATNAALAALTTRGVTAPELALGALNLSDVVVDPATGTVDQAALNVKVDELLTKFPMLVGSQGPQSYATGAQQQRVAATQLPSATKDGKLDENVLRWALGGRGPGG
jgi:hypothetical protein